MLQDSDLEPFPCCILLKLLPQVKDDLLLQSLTCIAQYAKAEQRKPTPDFAHRIKDLTVRLKNVLTDTAEMKKYEDDPEMLVDLQVRGHFARLLPSRAA